MADQLRPGQRQKQNQHIRGPGNVNDNEYNEKAGAKKVLPLGGKFIKPYLGALNAGVQTTLGAGSTVAVYNNSAATVFVTTGVAGLSAPTNATDGIPVSAFSWFYVSMGPDTHIRSSSANAFGYELDDDTYWVP